MINDKSTYFLNSDSIVMEPQNNTIKINNAFNPDGSEPDMLDVTTPNGKVTTIDISKYNDKLTASDGNMTYKFKDKREYFRFRSLLVPVMDPNTTTQTAYKHSWSFAKEMGELLKEITKEKNPDYKVKLEIGNYKNKSAYGFVPLGENKIAINIRRIDPKLKHLAVETMYHENEHISQFNSSSSRDYLRWSSLSVSDKSFYFSPVNPIEEDARIAGITFGRFNFRFAAEAMRNVDVNDWQDADRNIMIGLHNFAEANLGTAELDDTALKVFWGHVPMKETYPGRKTQRILRDYIESITTKTLPQQYEDTKILQDISYNILNTYIRLANAFNAGAGEMPTDISLKSWTESYVQRVRQDPRFAKKINFNDSRIYDDRNLYLKKRMENALGSLFGNNSPPNDPSILNKITNAMFHGGNRIKWK